MNAVSLTPANSPLWVLYRVTHFSIHVYHGLEIYFVAGFILSLIIVLLANGVSSKTIFRSGIESLLTSVVVIPLILGFLVFASFYRWLPKRS